MKFSIKERKFYIKNMKFSVKNMKFPIKNIKYDKLPTLGKVRHSTKVSHIQGNWEFH